MESEKEPEEIKEDLLPRQKYSVEEIIVVAPGTAAFKIGLASLKSPVAVPSVFALKRKPPFCAERPKKDYFDMSNILDFSLNCSDELKIKNELLSLCLRSEVYSNYIEPPSKEQIRNEEKYGEDNCEEPLPADDSALLSEGESGKALLFGAEARDLGESAAFDTIPFFRNGFLNIEEVSEPVLSEIFEKFFVYALALNEVKIQKNDFKDYCIAFVVPMSFCKTEVVFFAEIFMRMGFKSILFHLEPVLACFGTGFSGACVVDIGHESTKVCCVQYGSAVMRSRIVLPYGGKNISDLLLHTLLTPSLNEFHCPLRAKIKQIKPHSLWQTVEKLKADTCAFPTAKRVVRNFVAEVRLRNGERFTAKMTVSDAAALAPLGLFRPDVFPVLERSAFAVHSADRVRYEYEKTLLVEPEESPAAGAAEASAATRLRTSGLSNAIFDSIMSLSKPEDRESMATSILLVGGVVKMPGSSEIIEKEVKSLLREKKSPISNVEKLPRRDEKESGLAPEFCSWLGMSIICGNEGCREMWITPKDWGQKSHILLLRRKVPFEILMDVSNELNNDE